MEKYRVTLTAEERAQLEHTVSVGKAAARKLTHARILLLADTSQDLRHGDEDIVAALGTSLRTVERVRQRLVTEGASIPVEMLSLANELTDANAAIFDVANDFAGCIPGVHEILRRQGLLQGTWCLDPDETLGPGQAEEIDRVCRAYPHLNDDAFVREHLDEWLAG